MFTPKTALILILIAFLAGFGFYIAYPTPDNYDSEKNDADEGDRIACTMEAKLCPDGSYVGRVPPNCEFETCPDENSTKSIPQGAQFEDGVIE